MVEIGKGERDRPTVKVGDDRGRERERGERGSQREGEWGVVSRVKYNTCLSVCLRLVVYRNEGSVGLVVGCGPLWACQGHCELTCLMLVHLSDLEGCCALNVNWLKFGQTALQ